MTKQIALLIALATFASTQWTHAMSGKIMCKVMDSVLLGTMNGESKRYTHINGRISKNEQFTISYTANESKSEPFSLSIEPLEKVFEIKHPLKFTQALRKDDKNYGSMFEFKLSEFLFGDVKNYFYDKVNVYMDVRQMNIEMNNEKISLHVYDSKKGLWDGTYSHRGQSQILSQTLRCRTSSSQHEAVIESLKNNIKV